MFKNPCYQGRWNKRYAGTEALSNVGHHGYPRGNIYNKPYRAHRVAWALHYGEWPCGEIDHINGIRHDNRICNLRIATGPENSRNLKRRSDNTSGYKGVSKVAATGKWRAYINLNGKQYSLGYYDTAEAAAAAYANAAPKFHGEFARWSC
jgi:hypothetical protein